MDKKTLPISDYIIGFSATRNDSGVYSLIIKNKHQINDNSKKKLSVLEKDIMNN